MRVETIISTINKDKIDDLKLSEKNIHKDCLIINQVLRERIPLINEKKEGINFLSFREKGLSKSRNRGIKKSKHDIILLTDDDVYYKQNFNELLINEFNKNPEVDILTFKIETSDGKEFKDYNKKEFYHNYKSILKVSSVEIALRKKKIDEYDLKYDEMFGLGSIYKTGEENIFLYDALKKGCNIKYIPITIAIHPEGTSGKRLTEENIFAKGALFYRLFGIKAFFINLFFILKKRKEIRVYQTVKKAIKSIYSGSYDYIRRQNEFK